MKRSLIALAAVIAATSLASQPVRSRSTRTLTPGGFPPPFFGNAGKQKAQWKRERRGRK